MAEDYFSLLGVARNATDAELKAAYRKLAMKYHPDRNPGDKKAEETFRKINTAYGVLSDPQKRQVYEHYGEAGLSGAGAGGPGGPGGADLGEMFGDIFENFFGAQGGGGRRARRGGDLKYEMNISLDDAFKGAQVPLEYPRQHECSTCKGSGARGGSEPKRCTQCRGSGRVQFSQGFFSMTQVCSACGGEGQMIDNPCRECRGSGRESRNARLTIKIPPGIYEGATLRISGEGESGPRGTPAGDLYVHIRVKNDPRFDRVEDDLVVSRKLDIASAALGSSLDLPIIDGGSTRIKIPAGVQHGAIMRVQGKGMPRLHGRGRGDLMVKLEVEVPRHLTDDQRRILTEFAKTLDDSETAADPSTAQGKSTGIFNKIFGE